MTLAILSDIHGNLEALEAVLGDIERRGITRIGCLGDVIGYGPNPCECLDRARQFEFCLLGNHDQAALFDPEGFSQNAERAAFWTRQQLVANEGPESLARIQFLAVLPRTLLVDGKTFVHGSVRAPLNEYVFPEDIYNERKIQKIFAMIPRCCFQGHTHVPGVFTSDCRFLRPADLVEGYRWTDEKFMVNVGSVGQPRDNDPRACYLLIHDDRLEFVRVEYPWERTRAKIHQIPELDDLLGDRLELGR
ncbi:MAG: metallophosphoesterase family protein [Pirellulaceae bacterium]